MKSWMFQVCVFACVAWASPFAGAEPAARSFELGPGDTAEVAIGQSAAGAVWSLTISASGLIGERDEVYVDLTGPELQIGKTLHAGDPDLFVTFAPKRDGDLKVNAVRRFMGDGKIALTIDARPWPADNGKGVQIEAEPNNSWRDANAITLGRTIYASGDDAPYIVSLDAPAEGLSEETLEHAAHARTLGKMYAQESDFKHAGQGMNFTTIVSNLNRSVDWYRLEFAESEPRLVMFWIELLDRDNIPADVSVYRLEGDDIAPYDEGLDPVSPPHEVQALPGNKFTTRVLKQGTYLLRVVPNHPDYQLKTRAYPVPPYGDPRQAVRTAMDFIVGAGDSWHANTPRTGGLVDRVADVHAETAQCVACHPTHFSMRAEMTAAKNGYSIYMRPQVKFLAERFYNNPRPFYGHTNASWARMISAAANVLNRPASILMDYEDLVNGGEYRLDYLKPIAEYLRLYYKGIDKPKDNESNGNKPLVSTYEVAFYSWDVFNRLYKKTGDESYKRDADQIQALIEQDAHKDMLDLAYQTIALAKIDKEKYAAKLKENGEKILSYQRPSGMWSMEFKDDSTEVEFQTGHCLYALAVAGFDPKDDRIARGIDALMKRQLPFGGWFDPTQAYENFRTPFRETQFAIMALSEFYPKGSLYLPSRIKTSNDPRDLIQEMDQFWPRGGVFDPHASSAVIRESATHPETQVRYAAVSALGRVGGEEDIPIIAERIGDPSKLVQRAAAWSLRQLASEKGIGHDAIAKAMRHENERVRWGAHRALYRHFAGFVKDGELFDAVKAGLDDPSPTVRLQASKTLSRWYYWSGERETRRSIENALLARMGKEKHPWAARGLREAYHNVLDENTRYLYNNWIPLLAQEEDRKQAIEGHRAVVRDQAEVAAEFLKTAEPAQAKEMLQAMAEFHLREGSYLLKGRYNRIGNDVERIEFYPEAAEIFYPAVLPWMKHEDARIREYATKAAYLARKLQSNELSLAFLERLKDSDDAVRSAAHEYQREFNVKIDEGSRGPALALVQSLLADPRAEVKIDGVNLAAKWSKDLPEAGEAVAALLDSEDEASRLAAIGAIRSFGALHEKPAVAAAILEALDPERARLFGEAFSVAMNTEAVAKSPEVRARLDEIMASQDSGVRRQVLARLDKRWAKDERVIALVAASLQDPAEDVRRQALEKVTAMREFGREKAIRDALDGAKTDSNPLVRSAAAAYFSPGVATFASVNPREALDFNFFRARVEPLLAKAGTDGQSCVECHVTHTIFKLQRPNEKGEFTLEQTKENFENAMKVVDLAYPESSLILRKPMSTAKAEGVVGANQLAHGGERRWENEQAEEYQTILRWLRGARLAEVTSGE